MEELYQGPIEDVKQKEVEFIQQYKEQGITLYNVYHNNLSRKKHNPYHTSIQDIDDDSDNDNDSDNDMYQETSSDNSDQVMVSSDSDQEI